MASPKTQPPYVQGQGGVLFPLFYPSPLTSLPDTSLTQIVTGAVIGRIDVRGYLLGTFLIVAILQPLVARWVWTT